MTNYTSIANAIKSGVTHGMGAPLTDGIAAGIGTMAVRGMGAPGDLAYRWPENRKPGLTYGELQEIGSWLRNYLLPPLLRGGAVNWYPESQWYRTPNVQRNEFGETAKQAWERIEQRWNGLKLLNKDEMETYFQMLRTELYMPNILGASWPVGGQQSRPERVLFKITARGIDGWYRFVGAMALGRDLFAENFQDIGGVQLGLNDKIEATLDQGVAVTGEWQNLAGRWIWKGYALDGSAIYSSDPLFAKPGVEPFDWRLTRDRNASLFRYLVRLLPAPQSDQAARAAVPTLIGLINKLGVQRRGFRPLGSVPLTGIALGELLVQLFEMLGIDATAAMGAAGEMLADQADLQFPWRDATPLDPVAMPETPQQEAAPVEAL